MEFILHTHNKHLSNLSIYLSITTCSLPIFLSFFLSIYLSITTCSLPIFLSIYLSIYLLPSLINLIFYLSTDIFNHNPTKWSTFSLILTLSSLAFVTIFSSLSLFFSRLFFMNQIVKSNRWRKKKSQMPKLSKI